MQIDKTRQILQLLEDSYFGTGGFEYCTDDTPSSGVVPIDMPISVTYGTGSYIVKHPRETAKHYNARLAIAYYLNYMAPVVDSHVNPLFRKEVTRTVNASTQALWDAFAEDVNGGGKSLTEIMREAAFPAKRDGIHILVVTAPPDAPKTAAQAMKSRPYIYGVHALDIVKIERDRAGKIVLLRHLECVDGEDRPAVRELRPNGWSLTSDEGVLIKSGEFGPGLKSAPVVELSPGLTVRGQMLPRSEFVGVARCNHRLFNLCSELDEVFRNQTFSILTYPSKDTSKMTTGTNNVMGYDPTERMAPAFIAPPDGPAKMLMEQFDRLVREIYRMSLLTHQTGSTSKNSSQNLPSGIALRIDRETLDSALTEFGKQLEDAEEQIAQLWAWWTGETITEFDVSYPRNFTLQDLATELQPLLDAWTALAGTAPKPLQAGMLQKIADLILEGDDDALQEVADDLAVWVQDKSAPGMNTPTPPTPPAQPDASGDPVA